MLPDSVGGLPLHPLIVHAAVILVPLAAVGIVIVPWRAAWRRAYSLPLAAIALAGFIASYIAKESGERLERAAREAGRQLGEHPEMGTTATVVAFLLAGAAVALFLYDRFGDRFQLPLSKARQKLAITAVCVVVAAAAMFTMIQAGHSGADIVWGQGSDLAQSQAP